MELIASGIRFDNEFHKDTADHRRIFSYLTGSRYSRQLRWWLDAFPREQFYITLSERFYADTQNVMGEVTEFLGLPPHDYKVGKKWNDGKYEETFPEADHEFLREALEEERRELPKVLGWDPWETWGRMPPWSTEDGRELPSE